MSKTQKQNNTHDIDRTRERILNSAEKLFADKGFDATSIREITANARCNVAAVNYHFGDKEGLYDSVFQHRMDILRETRIAGINEVFKSENDSPSLEKLLRSFIAAFLEPLLDKDSGQRSIQLIIGEMHSPRLPRDKFVSQVIEPIHNTLLNALLQICPELDRNTAKLCIFSVVGQLLNVVRSQRLVAKTGRLYAQEFDIQEIQEHIVRFSIAGINHYIDKSAK